MSDVGRAVRAGCAPLPRRRAPDRSTGWSCCCPPRPGCSCDDRMLPIGREPVEGTAYDFRVAAAAPGHGARRTRSPTSTATTTGVATRRAARPGDRARRGAVGRRAARLAAGLQRRRPCRLRRARSLAVEPMTAPADAFRSGDDLVTLSPAGEPGDELSASWGIRGAGLSASAQARRAGDQRAQLAHGAPGAVAVGALDAHHRRRWCRRRGRGSPRARPAAGGPRPPRPTRTRGAGSR